MDGRQARGRVLAQAQGDRIKPIEGDLWFCPSSQGGGYIVDMAARRCGCADGSERCKHLVAVEIVRAGRAGAETKPETALVPAPAPPPPAPVKPIPPPKGDLTVEEQAAVRRALKFVRARCGGWDALAKGTRFEPQTLRSIAYGRPPGANIAVRLARFVEVPVDDVLRGRWPPKGVCVACGHVPPIPAATVERP